MKRLQKSVLLSLALALLLCLFASCADRREEQTEPEQSLSQGDGAGEEWKDPSASHIVMRYGERELNEADYVYLMATVKEYYEYYVYYYYGQDISAMWEEPQDNGATFAEMLTETVNNSAKMMLVVEQLCADAGLTLDEDALAEVGEYIQQMIDDYGGEKQMEEALASLGMSVSGVERYERYNRLLSLLREYRYGENGVARISREEVREAFLAGYAKVEGYFYSYLTTDSNGNADYYRHDFGPDAEAQAKAFFKDNYVTVRHILYKDEAKAKEVYDGILAGTTTFAEHESETIDSGVQYTFTYGRMVEPFEKAAYAMPIGSYELVQTDFGWHILYRLELEEDDFDLSDVTADMSREFLKEEAKEMYEALLTGSETFAEPADGAPYSYTEPTLVTLSSQNDTLKQALAGAAEGEIVYVELTGYGVYILRKLATADEELDEMYDAVEEPLVQEAFYSYLEGCFNDVRVNEEALDRFDIRTAQTLS